MLGVRLDKRLEKKLDKFAAKSGETRSDYVKRALRHQMDREEREASHDNITKQAMNEMNHGQHVSEKAVFAYLDLWGGKTRVRKK